MTGITEVRGMQSSLKRYKIWEMQAKGPPTPPVGVIFDTALSRSEHVLALGALYRLQASRDARVAGLSVSRPDLRVAAFCDALSRSLSGNGGRNPAPIGISSKAVQGRNALPLAEAVLNARTPDGAPRYPHGVQKLNDTADVAALIRNGISAQQPQNGAVVVAGPLSNLSAALTLPDVLELAPKRVRSLVLACTPDEVRADLDAARKVLQLWPTPVMMADLSELLFPGATLQAKFEWASIHPVRDAYEADGKMPYDAPLQSAAAVLYAAKPKSELFAVSAAGKVDIAADGRMRFTEGAGGTHRMLRVAAGQKDAAVEALVSLITAPAAQPGAGRGKGKQE